MWRISISEGQNGLDGEVLQGRPEFGPICCGLRDDAAGWAQAELDGGSLCLVRRWYSTVKISEIKTLEWDATLGSDRSDAAGAAGEWGEEKGEVGKEGLEGGALVRAVDVAAVRPWPVAELRVGTGAGAGAGAGAEMA